MTTMTITTTVDLTTMSDDTLTKQIESNRENARKATAAINAHLLGERIVPGEKDSYRYAASLMVADLSVGDLVAEVEVTGTRYSRNSVRPGENVTERLIQGYGAWSLYVVTAKTAKRVTVRRIKIVEGYYDDPYNQGNTYDGWPSEDGHIETWGDKNDRFIFPMGTLVEAQERLAQVPHRVERFQRTYDARQSLIAEVARRKAVKDAERDTKRAPRKAAVARVNKIAGITLLTFAGYDWRDDGGEIAWSYEMRGQSFSKDTPSRFVMGLAAQVIAFRRLRNEVSAEDYAFVWQTVEALPGGKEFASSIDALTAEDDGTQDEDEV